MVSALVYILIVVVVGAAIAGIIQYAPFIAQPFKQWAMFAVGAVVVVLVILALVPLISAAA
jgi:hypothetical protein